MNPDLLDNTWVLGGTSMLWDAGSLNGICNAGDVRSLREFLRLHKAGWPEHEVKLIKKRTLVVGGLEAAMDTLHPDHACEWLEENVYPAVLDFQENVADGGREAALILWFADAKRIFSRPADNTYHWWCSGEHRQQAIPIGRCIWNGAEGSVRRIIRTEAQQTRHHIGLFLQRIS
jgi:hypothetical protein